ncbi:MAG: hypothetical protein ABI638_13280 [Ignavibacteriota bacterium]
MNNTYDIIILGGGIAEAERMVHVLNAPSSTATASFSIGKRISQMVIKNFNEEVV